MPSNDVVREQIQLLSVNQTTLRQEIEALIVESAPMRLRLKAIDYRLMQLRSEYRRVDREKFLLTKRVKRIAPNGTGKKHPVTLPGELKLDDLVGKLKSLGLTPEQLKNLITGDTK